MQVREKIHINFILQTASLLAAELLVSSMRLALTGRRCAAFKSVPGRFVTHSVAVSMHLE
ncbi:hypothetical protein DK853_00910 [Klebsiella oxytoca]|nr:hypothetical protein CEQ13_14075 [Klebsiella oxytoca]AYZ54123.1 hypothetical protein EGY21_23290 [Klebsiella oxytoca]RBA00679.1 hypothetical protein DK853_00910 [Klebsiella oxytoca]RRZ75414.1 hypothetical protein EGK39_10880 [Klebsiella oxytoca]